MRTSQATNYNHISHFIIHDVRNVSTPLLLALLMINLSTVVAGQLYHSHGGQGRVQKCPISDGLVGRGIGEDQSRFITPVGSVP